ncbi:MAG: hypothetical protein KC420_18175, partial [Myxococcales bacterium]|nr:hypothetical protein [Myxococcales bacterium]
GERERLEIYHDRLRETLVAGLTEETTCDIHRHVAKAMEQHGLDDPEALFGHYRAAGDRTRAALYADRAATRASEALAFDLAAQFYRHAIELVPGEDSLSGSSVEASRLGKARLERGLGDALANAGRCRDAAHAYIRAAKMSNSRRALELRRSAAEQLLISGHLDEGREVLGEVLAQAGLRLAPTPKRALLSLVTRRLQLKLRGYGFTERPAEQVPPDKLHLIDICWAVSTGLSMIDNIRGNDYAARGLLQALEAGEPIRVANAMSMEAGFLASGGDRSNRAQAFVLSKQASELAEKTGSAAAIAQTTMIAAACNYLSGLWRRAVAYATEADVMLRERCPGAIWQKATSQRFGFGALMYAGEIGELVRRLPFALRDAEERGNLYSDADLKARLFMHWLARDATQEHRDALAEVFRRWTSQGYHIQHFNALRSLIHGDLYEGAYERASERFKDAWPALKGSMLLRVQVVRAEAHQLKAMLGLARLAAGKVPTSKRRGVLKAVDKEIKALHGEGEPWCAALADLLRAGHCKQSGDDDGALRHLPSAHHDLGAADMASHAAAAERALGLLLGGDAGAAKAAKAEAWMREQSIVDPARVTQALVV